jgi:beta-galactosidase
VHHDAAGAPRVVFVLHPGPADVVARLSVPAGARGTGGADLVVRDLLDGSRVPCEHGAIELRMPPRSARVLELAGA